MNASACRNLRCWRCLFGCANEHRPSCLKLARRQMMMRNVARRSTQRFGCSRQLRVPFSLRRPRNRGDDFLNLRGCRNRARLGPARPASHHQRDDQVQSSEAPADSRTGTENSAPSKAAFSSVSRRNPEFASFTGLDIPPRSQFKPSVFILHSGKPAFISGLSARALV